MWLVTQFQLTQIEKETEYNNWPSNIPKYNLSLKERG